MRIRQFLHRIGLHWWRPVMYRGPLYVFDMDPLHGVRECRLCGRVEWYWYDSQGGSWNEQPHAGEREALEAARMIFPGSQVQP